MHTTKLIDNLINALRCLPGVGPKSAQRMAFYLLQHGRANGQVLAKVLEQAIQQVGNCRQCRTLSETPLCHICSNPRRDESLLCIVETPLDVVAIEQTNNYKGLYFVLMGHLSPLDGIGPENIGIEALQRLLQQKQPQEVILATNPTVEGEATAHYLASILRHYQRQQQATTSPTQNATSQGLCCTRLAHGMPMGGELEYLDSNTLGRALQGRQVISS
jgi:recombination protein RecR